ATSFCTEINNTYVSQWDPSAPNKWSKEISTANQTGSIGVLQLGTVTTNSPIANFAANRYFTLGTDRPFLNNPLPVKLISFSANKTGNMSSIVTWELADVCMEATQFTIEKSIDGKTFQSYATQAGNPNSRNYFYNDTKLGKGTTWYRLKITEADGKITYSKVVALINDTKGLLITSLMPNPVTGSAVVTVSAARSLVADTQVVNVSGTIVRQWRSAVAEGSNQLTIDMSALPAGVYHLVLQTADSKAVYRLVKQ
ncbi:MAG TPA: T9SS type A sorting domain-containing protein, partial [Chitinophagaceae bacterium]|nr:T9SS type A sorting domain-containing protein [Chitinophagaceae bacterium]